MDHHPRAIVRVLLVDRSEDVPVQVLGELQRGGYRTVWERVMGLDALATALEKHSWDLIVCSSADATEMRDMVALCRRLPPNLLLVAVAEDAETLGGLVSTEGKEAWLLPGALEHLAPLVKKRTEAAICQS